MEITLLPLLKSDPGGASVHSDGIVGAIKPFKVEGLVKPKCSSCNTRHVRGVPCFQKAEWDESKHPRGEPGNAGEFGSGGGAPTTFTPLPRDQMPQLGGPPVPGTPSASLPANSRGNVDLSDAFIGHLTSKGINTSVSTVAPSSLKPSQAEINPETVDSLAEKYKAEAFTDEKPLWVSSDNYVIDGHHRWAAAKADNDRPIPIRKVDLPIADAINEARTFAHSMGLKQETVSESHADDAAAAKAPKKDLSDTALDQASRHGGFSLSPHTGGAPAGGYMVALQGHNVDLDGITDLKDPGQRAQVKTAVVKFLKDNADLFASNPHAYVGGWSDTKTGQFTLDPSENVMDKDQAVTLGGQRNQLAVWDVIAGKEIETGGTGDRPTATTKSILQASGAWGQRRGDRPVGRGIPRQPERGRSSGNTFVDTFRSVFHRNVAAESAAATDESAEHRRAIAGDGSQFRLIKAFDPDESRDAKGEWSSGGDGDESSIQRGPAGREARISAADKKDRKPTKAMKNLVQRDSVVTVGDLKPGDVMTSTMMDGTKTYHTIEHISEVQRDDPNSSADRPTKRGYTKMISRTPSGRMSQHSAPSESPLGQKNERGFADMKFNTPGWNYVGSEPAVPIADNVVGLSRPKFRDTALITRPLLSNPVASQEVAKAVAIVESRCAPHSLDGLRLSSTSQGIASNVFAHYKMATDTEHPTIEVNQRWINGEIGNTEESSPQAVQELGQSYRKTVESKFHPNRNGYSALTSIAVHEIGHHLHLRKQTRLGPNAQAILASKIDPEFNYFDHGTYTFSLIKGCEKTVSSYATANIREFVAEAYTEGMLADRPRPMAKLIAKVLNGETVEDGDVTAAKAQWDKALGYDAMASAVHRRTGEST